MPKQWLLTPAAAADVDDIWAYTAERWSNAQAEIYLRRIEAVLNRLSSGAAISRPANLRQGYRKASAGSHIIYFREDDAGNIVVVRILHQRMDAERHL